MTLDLPPLHDALAFLSPMSGARADRLAVWLAEDLHDGTVLDVGCGWAELLLRVVQLAPAARGVGIDLDEQRVDEGRRRAGHRGLADRVRLLAGDGATAAPSPVDALVAIGSSQVWGADVEEAQPLDYGAALSAIRSGVRRGARVVYGEAVWTRPPTPEATARLAGRDDEYVALADLVALAHDHGFAVVACSEASQEEWDDFESGFTARYATWQAAHPADHPDAEEVRRRARQQQAGYLGGYRGVLGLAYLQLLAV